MEVYSDTGDLWAQVAKVVSGSIVSWFKRLQLNKNCLHIYVYCTGRQHEKHVYARGYKKQLIEQSTKHTYKIQT